MVHYGRRRGELRILKLGYQSIYVNRTYGHGIMPLNFEGLKKQRFRWCFGGVQILRKHWEALMPWARWIDPTNRLTGAQRYYYFTSSLQWFNELSTMVFTVLLLIGAMAVVLRWDIRLQPLAGGLVVVPLVSVGPGAVEVPVDAAPATEARTGGGPRARCSAFSA